MSTTDTISSARAGTVRVVCLISSLARSSSGLSVIHETRASSSRATIGGRAGSARRSPRETSTSSSSRIVTDSSGRRLVTGLARDLDRRDAGPLTRRQHDDLVARTPDAARDLPRVAAVVVMLVRHRANHPLHREPAIVEVAVRRDLDRLEMLEQRPARVPRHRVGPVDDVVALERRDGNRRCVPHAEPERQIGELASDLVEALLREVDEVHLVDGVHDVRQLEHRRDVRVPACLLDHTLARVDEDHRDVCGRRSGDHVARVLHVTRCIGQLEAAARGDEAAIRDVDRDPLLALGAQPVGQQRQVDVVVPAPARRIFDVLELVDEDLLRVEQQAPDQRRLAVVDRARRDETQQLGVEKLLRSSQRASCLPSPRRRRGRRRASRRAR